MPRHFRKGEIRFKVWELGGQIVGYPLGHFDHGMQLGVEVLYAGVLGDTTVDGVTVSGSANGLSLGPLIGYKFAADIGFAQHPARHRLRHGACRGEGEQRPAGRVDERQHVRTDPQLNLGWSI